MLQRNVQPIIPKTTDISILLFIIESTKNKMPKIKNIGHAFAEK